MARFETDFGIDPMQYDLASEKVGDACIKAIEAAEPIQVEATKSALRSVIKGGNGGLVNSIKATKPKKAVNGAYIGHVRPTGTSTTRSDNGKPRKQPVRNMAIAAYLEYGVGGRQPARPWAQKATNDAQGRVSQTIEQVFRAEMEGMLT